MTSPDMSPEDWIAARLAEGDAITPAGELRQAVALMRADASSAGTVTGMWTPEAARAVADLLASIAFLMEQDFAQAGPAARALIAARAYMGTAPPRHPRVAWAVMADQPEMYVSLGEWAAAHGVSRQFADQALARSEERPLAAVRIGELVGYRPEELDRWWMSYSPHRWAETRRVRAEHGSIQVNCRLGPHHVEQLDALRLPGEARASAATRILRAAVAAQLEAGRLARGEPLPELPPKEDDRG